MGTRAPSPWQQQLRASSQSVGLRSSHGRTSRAGGWDPRRVKAAGHQARDSSDPGVQVNLSRVPLKAGPLSQEGPGKGQSICPLTICQPERGLPSLKRRKPLQRVLSFNQRSKTSSPGLGVLYLSSYSRIPDSRLPTSRAAAWGHLWMPVGRGAGPQSWGLANFTAVVLLKVQAQVRSEDRAGHLENWCVAGA